MGHAIGCFEAAALAGVHFTLPRRMADKGLLSCRNVATAQGAGANAIAIYDRDDVEQNYREYEDSIASGERQYRPRAWLHLRPEALKRLKAVKTHISFDDAISVHEAASLLGVHHTLVPRYLRSGRIVGRLLWSGRKNASRLWIVSRKSCMEDVKNVKKEEAAGTKRGRKRYVKK